MVSLWLTSNINLVFLFSSILVIQYYPLIRHIRTKWIIPYNKHPKIDWCYLFLLKSIHLYARNRISPLNCVLWKVKFSLHRKMVQGLIIYEEWKRNDGFQLMTGQRFNQSDNKCFNMILQNSLHHLFNVPTDSPNQRLLPQRDSKCLCTTSWLHTLK